MRGGMDTVECPGCRKRFDPALMNDTSLGIEIRSFHRSEETTMSIFYCPSCGEKVRNLDQEELVDKLEVLVRTWIAKR